MKKTAVFIVVLVIIISGFVFFQNSTEHKNGQKDAKVAATIYKSPTCGCCGVYASYMKKEGYDVEIKNTEELSAIKRELGVPYELESCHTTKVGGYVVEGHIPEEAIQKLLAEKPDIKGIGMPGMPSGSPGMPGLKTDSFVIYKIMNDGTTGDIFMMI